MLCIHSFTSSGWCVDEQNDSSKVQTDPERFPVVGIGASAGGLGALSKFFEGLPEECGMAFVVIVHLDPTHKSHMAELLQRHTTLRVRQVTRAIKVEPNQVYIIPPDKDLTLTDGHFKLSARAMPNRSRAPIDGFFKTLADTRSTEAIGIILSGTGSDGTQGLTWIKERGGITMAQSPSDAEYPSMPTTAIATGHVDVILPAAQLGAEAKRLCELDLAQTQTQDGDATLRGESTIREILNLIRLKTDHDFSGYKRSTINRRIRRRAEFAHSKNLAAYLAMLRQNKAELETLYNDLLISVTSFFRDPEAFAALESEVIPGLFKKADNNEPIRVWITGCATGEEAYSVAILLCEQEEKLTDPPPVQIFATDVHDRGFAYAREGFYPETIAADVTPERLERYFTAEKGGYRIKKSVREKVIFASHNLLRDPPFLRVDLVNCRNVLIYLQRESQRRVLQVFHFALRPGGHLFLGTSESVEDVAKSFRVVDKKHRIFRSLDRPREILALAPNERATRIAEPRATEAPRSGGAFSIVHRKLLEAYAPPSLVVNKSGEIVHLSDGVGSFLQFGAGEPSNKLVEMLPGSARSKVRALLSNAFAGGAKPATQIVEIAVGDRKRKVVVSVRQLAGSADDESFALVIFDEREKPGPRLSATADRRRRSQAESGDRGEEAELEDLRAQLNASVEEHEGAIEELKASNEELQSINEEQRATEEELEASKEELQSINEELNTINQEFRNKNEQLSELNADLVNLIDSTDIATIFLDRSLRVRRYTPAVSALFNLRPADMGRPLADLAHRLEYPKLIEDAGEVLRTLVRCETEVRASDGRWYMMRISPYRSLDDRIDGVVISLLDTTARRAAEVDREELLTEVQASSIAKSNFIGVMSHELRTPLNAILGYADILMAGAVGPISEEQNHHLDRIKSSASHLAHMIDDSLQSVRIEAGITSLDNEGVDIASIVREVAMVTEPLIRAKSLEFSVTAEPGPTIVADATKIRQILFNLLGNAVRYTDSGTVSLSSKVTEHGAMISVEDTGIGISTDHMEKIFERFWQVDQSKTRLRGGAGLGLMVSRSLARVMGGELHVTSEIGRGSRFVVRLPLVPPAS